MALKAGVMEVLHKFHYRGVKVVVCRYFNTFNYFFAFKGDVYLDFIQLPDIKEMRANKIKIEDIEKELVSRLCNNACENIDFHIKRTKVVNKILKYVKEKFGSIRLAFSQSKLSEFVRKNWGFLKVSGGGFARLGNEEVKGAGQASAASEVRHSS